jgi:hypothetical protein
MILFSSLFFISYTNCKHVLRSRIGTNAMASKSKRRIIVQKKAVDRKHCSPKKRQSNARRSVTKRAPTSEEECWMRFRVYLNGSNHWYLHSFGSCLDHKHHPKLDVAANTLSEKDLSDAELKLTNLLYNVNVPLSTIAKVLTTLRDDDVGTFLPKTLFNINKSADLSLM